MLVLVLVLVLVLALVLVLVAPVTVHALRRSRFLVPPYSSLNDLRERQSYSPGSCAGAGDGAGAGGTSHRSRIAAFPVPGATIL